MPFKDGSYDDAEFWELITSDTPTLLAFWSHTCAPCKVMAPVFERLGKRFKRRMAFVAVSVYDREDIAKRFGVSSTPTFIITRRGKSLRHIYGVIHESKFAEQLETYALPAPPEEPKDQKRGILERFRRREVTRG
ncbi:MAG TPA: thioredoxin family protein [Dehalococcoidia bacterium]|nr:thioredoxin family protein [Dehalococcoidia bacterium]